jgi:hypothetical protein
MPSRKAVTITALVLLPSLAACGQVGARDVSAVAGEFYAAYQAKDGRAACRELAPATRSELAQSAGAPCERALLQEQVPAPQRRLDVRVFGTAAQVRFAGDTAFLARFQDGWKVTAVGCEPRRDLPDDCSISGG